MNKGLAQLEDRNFGDMSTLQNAAWHSSIQDSLFKAVYYIDQPDILCFSVRLKIQFTVFSQI